MSVGERNKERIKLGRREEGKEEGSEGERYLTCSFSSLGQCINLSFLHFSLNSMFTDTQPFSAAFCCMEAVTRADDQRIHLTVTVYFMRKEGGHAEAWESPLYPIQLWGDFL